MPGITKRQIAILGGGVGAMTAAFELTNYDGWQDDHDVTVYQMGWRLGGKGASGRNADISNRIEEHGLHFWMGFYENAFNVIRQVYDECRVRQLMPHSEFQDWQKAFTRQDTATAMEKMADGSWKPWSMYHPPNSLLPGEPTFLADDSALMSPSRLFRMLLTRLSDVVHDTVHDIGEFKTPLPQWASDLLGPAAALVTTALHGLTALVDHARDDADHDSQLVNLTQALYEEFLQKTKDGFVTDAVRHAGLLLDAGMAMVRGMVRDSVLIAGFEAIDQYDLVEWLQKHGMKQWPNPFIIAGYDTAFAYEKGNPQTPNISAGVGLYGVLRMMLTYRGSLFWKMNAGMGDIVFAPLFLVLRARGVKFNFFHRVTALHLSSNQQWIDSIDIDVQAEPISSEYDPLIDFGGHPCWPAQPKSALLQNPDAFKNENFESDNSKWKVKNKTLRRHQDFDEIVLGIPVGALQGICKELIAADPGWADMIKNVGTVQTQAVQLWTNRSADELGFPPQFGQPACITAFAKPFDTWADMSHLLSQEGWDAALNVKHVGYLCTALPEDPKNTAQVVKDNARKFLETEINRLWPNSGSPFDWGILVDPQNRSGVARLDSQYFRANTDGTERYVLSLKGTTHFRLHPEVSGFVNLYLAGDWTWNVLNCGCVEAAAISGKLAARAMCGHPAQIFGVFGASVTPAPLVAPAVAGTPAAAIRAKWQRVLLANLPPQNDAVLRAQAITAQYARAYINKKDVYKWAGVAAFACSRIAFALQSYNPAKAGGPITAKFIDDLDFLRAANNLFFQEVGWALLAYASPGGGINEVKLGLADKPDTDLLTAFVKIENAQSQLGTPAGDVLIWEATSLIEKYGQAITQSEFWENIGEVFDVFMNTLTFMNFDANPLATPASKTTSFSRYMWTWGLPFVFRTMKLAPDIRDKRHRWYWIEKSVLPLWKQLESTQKKDVETNLALLGGPSS